MRSTVPFTVSEKFIMALAGMFMPTPSLTQNSHSLGEGKKAKVFSVQQIKCEISM